MKIIELTKGKYALVDDDDFESLSSERWYYTSSGYAARMTSGEMVMMHRKINQTPMGMHTDHINGNRLDNRRANLRSATVSQNQANRPKQRNNTSGYKGVIWQPRRQKWLTHIQISGKCKHLGYFNTAEEAYSVYLSAAYQYQGEFAGVVR